MAGSITAAGLSENQGRFALPGETPIPSSHVLLIGKGGGQGVILLFAETSHRSIHIFRHGRAWGTGKPISSETISNKNIVDNNLRDDISEAYWVRFHALC